MKRFELDEPPPEEPGLLMTSMLDVIFILLAAFICVSEVRKGSLNVDLPDVNEVQPSSRDADTIVVEISVDDEILVAGKRARTLDELDEHLKDLSKRYGDRAASVPVQISNDDRGRHGMTMKVLGRLSRAGFRRVQFVVEEEG